MVGKALPMSGASLPPIGHNRPDYILGALLPEGYGQFLGRNCLAVLPKLLPISHGDPMGFHKKVEIPPIVLSLTHVYVVVVACENHVLYDSVVLACYCAMVPRPLHPSLPITFFQSEESELLWSDWYVPFVKSNVISTREGSLFYLTEL